MKVLLAHNFYQQPGGEDLVFSDESRLLESHGHQTIRYTVHNEDVQGMSALKLGGRTIWNEKVRSDVRQLIARERPALVHVHNTLPLLSPALYYGASAEGVPIVQTLHNYRLICPAGLCFRDGKVCTDCVGKSIARPAVQHGCYRGSRPASTAIATMLFVHRLLRTWERKVTVYIALTEMSRQMFVDGGLPRHKITVKPNFVDPDPGRGSGAGGYALFVGRLSPEKGLQTLLEAWRLMRGEVPLFVAGDGPLAADVARAAETVPGLTWLGRRDPSQIQSLLRDAMCLIFPSEWYETFGRVVIEAFAAATPVIAAGHGAAAELVRHGETGLHFRPADPADLAARVMLLSSDAELQTSMRAAARSEFETRYTSEINYQLLMAIYDQALASHRQEGMNTRARRAAQVRE
jgi:glycosyltransferase involved in cell wall biosynthesis